MNNNDTIVAISGGQARAGISKVRLSGNNVVSIVSKFFKGKKPLAEIKSHSVNYGMIVDPVTGERIDEVLLLLMKAPKTYTKEDVVEIDCHGGGVSARRILQIAVTNGARIAEAGEFTFRAFMNGRIDLSQAEAVADIISSETEEGTKVAMDQLEGKLSSKIKHVRGQLIEMLAHIEVVFDYPDHDVEDITTEKVYNDLKGIEKYLNEYILSYDTGKILKEGIKIVIAGRPNVGKSSLLNALSGYERSIVTDIPGTTRDTVEEYISINGIKAIVTDTAGIRNTEDFVEQKGVERARKETDRADLVIVIIDSSEQIKNEDLELVEYTKNKERIVIINKIDSTTEEILKDIHSKLGISDYIEISLLDDSGSDSVIAAIDNKIRNNFIKGNYEEGILTNIRHKNLLSEANTFINMAISACQQSVPLDCITIDIKNAVDKLGEITGENASDDVVAEIFKKFCVGK